MPVTNYSPPYPMCHSPITEGGACNGDCHEVSKATKILVLEISGAWTVRTRSSHKCIWSDGCHGKPHRNGMTYLELTSPKKGLYAERMDQC